MTNLKTVYMSAGAIAEVRSTLRLAAPLVAPSVQVAAAAHGVVAVGEGGAATSGWRY